MKYVLLLTLLFFSAELNAQFGKRLKDKAREAAERKANQKADEAINKSSDKIGSIITGKKRDKPDKSKPENETTNPASDNTGTSNNEAGSSNVETSYKEVIIKTNIRCEAGKKKIETILRNIDGVSSAMIDNDNGNLYLSSENPEVRNKVTEAIRLNGFEADGKKPTQIIPNLCK